MGFTSKASCKTVWLGLAPVSRSSVHDFIRSSRRTVSWSFQNSSHRQNFIEGYLWLLWRSHPWTCLTVWRSSSVSEPRPQILPRFSHNVIFLSGTTENHIVSSLRRLTENIQEQIKERSHEVCSMSEIHTALMATTLWKKKKTITTRPHFL